MQKYDEHWIQATTELGDRQTVMVQRDIHASDGRRLVARGSRIDSVLFNALSERPLLQRLEQCLRAENAVSSHQIRRTAESLRESSPFIDRLLASVARDLAPLEVIAQVPLNRAMAFKLTVARDRRPALYIHSVLVALIALFLAVRAGWNRPMVVRAVAAALFHDLGELHLPAAMFEQGHRLDDDERRQLHRHPLLVQQLLDEIPEYHPAIGAAVAEHHERLDGSGYPLGLAGRRISPLGRLLAVAEVAGSRFDAEGHCHDCQQLSTILKLNTRKLDPEFIGLLAPFYRHAGGAPGGEEASAASLKGKLNRVAELLIDWEEATAAQAGRSPGAKAEAVSGFVTRQVWELRQQLFDAGFNPRDVAAILDGADAEQEHLEEIETLSNEALWQLKTLLAEVGRRWPELPEEMVGSPLQRWLERVRSAVERD